MTLKIFTVFDSKVCAYLRPFFMRSKGEALRAWGEAVNDEKENFCRHPADYSLFEIGEFSEETGTLKMHEAKLSLGTALEHKHKPSNQVDLFNQPKAV